MVTRARTAQLLWGLALLLAPTGHKRPIIAMISANWAPPVEGQHTIKADMQSFNHFLVETFLLGKMETQLHS
jgi:hypothetical protein